MVDPRSIVDDVLEITVVGSFTSVGFEVRRRLFGWSDPHPGHSPDGPSC